MNPQTTPTKFSSPALELPTGAWRPLAGVGHVGFEVKTFWGLATVRGRFSLYDGTLRIGADHASAELTIDATSIDTGNAFRDRHLRSAAFFRTDEHRSVSFRSNAITRMTGGLVIAGELMIGETAIPLELPVDVGRDRAGRYVLRTRATVSRRVANVAWNRLGMIRGNAILTVELHLAPELTVVRGES